MACRCFNWQRQVGTEPQRKVRRFQYFADPVCIAALAIYTASRFYLKPAHVGGWLVHDYLNDFLCLPLFLPMILQVQRWLRIRRDDGYPRAWEIAQHWAIFSIMFEIVLPRFPATFHTVADPWDVVAYLLGGLTAWGCWRIAAVAS